MQLCVTDVERVSWGDATLRPNPEGVKPSRLGSKARLDVTSLITILGT